MSSAQSTTPLPLSWHVPGPSSRYHKREQRPRTTHTTSSQSSLTFDQHARSQSYSGAYPVASLPRTYIWSNSFMATAMEPDVPRTPVRQHQQSPSIRASPYSDYFTDEAQSEYNADNKNSEYAQPSSETQSLLRRLNNLGSHILRNDHSTHGLSALAKKLDLLESSLDAPDAQSRQPADMVDSGLFMDDDASDDQAHTPSAYGLGVQQTSRTPSFLGLDGAMEQAHSNSTKTRDVKIASQARLLRDAQTVLERVTKANTDLRKRFDEMRALNDDHILAVEDSAREIMELRSETEALKADLGFDHSELLFLKLQLKALEVQAEGLPDDGQQVDDSDTTKKGRVSVQDDIEKWKTDCEDVDARMRSRRRAHRVLSNTPIKVVRKREDGKGDDEEGEWRLEECRRRQGRVDSITIKRLSALGLDGSGDLEGLDMVPAGREGGLTGKGTNYDEHGTQTDVAGRQMILDRVGDEEVVAEEDEEEEEAGSPRRTPWQELCDSLVSLAGMDRD